MHQTRLMECFKLYIDLILEVIRAYEPHKAGILRPLARSPLVQLLTTAWIDSVVALHLRTARWPAVDLIVVPMDTIALANGKTPSL
ncbi:hypothetical protein MJO28_015133 [Puccinia striiformis f. sp. tritici]|uniref:Uncharacterized protein n=2 Tax=Puccinia striiformis f. sp. tritici TaxID=168172 RepID=A0A0L0UWL4_9BASI|nr:hypothetical protein MJO28_015133 [Puccinia striiformis f. sp. tritici]KNE91428.1 hypothetical protein PSTG_15175 [Puccinia striiformis f. sp. tritici PST-78]